MSVMKIISILLIFFICLTCSANAKENAESGYEAFKKGDFKKALEYYKLTINNESAVKVNEIWIARCMIELEQWIQAESILLEQLRREPENTIKLELLAYVFNKQGNWTGIINIYRELINIEPQNISYRITLAKMLMNQGQNEQAIDTLEFARRINISPDAQIYRLLADLYLAEGMHREAAQCYEKIINVLDNAAVEDYYRLGIAFFQTGDLISSEEAFKHMQKTNPDDFRADLYLGHVIAQSGRIDEAQAYYKDAVKKNPKSIESLEALAALQIKNKHYTDAASNYAKAVAMGDNKPHVYYNYIFSLMKEKDYASAREAIKKAIAEYPSDEKIRRLLDQHIKENSSE
ncbi:MAG: tetratricopeptide repeat protein [Sedimentisphaerales bacterium]|nr:tetratricopeptide repeat protein [Sedimentisphaerales bacterium]